MALSHSETIVIFPVFPGITQLDFTGPAQFLARLPRARIIAAAHTLDPVMTDSGFAILPQMTFADCPAADILCVPGGHGVAQALDCPATIAFIAQQASGARWTTSVCTGAFLLGKAGLLQSKHATTHWAYTHLLPLVGAIPTPGRIVEDGTTITAGGVTSGIDFALTLLAREAGEAHARMVQLGLEYNPAPPFPGGHPDCTAPEIVTAIQRAIYDEAASRMATALKAD